MADDTLEALTRFYKSEKVKIYSPEFACKHCELCKKAAEKAINKEKENWEDKRAYFEKQPMPAASKKAQGILDDGLKELLRHGQFTEANSAYVGAKYGSDGSGCRLLFLSLDPGSDDSSDNTWPREFRGLWDSRDDPSGRTPEGMRKRVIEGLEKDLESETFHFRLGPRGWVHWYCTHLLAVYILRAVYIVRKAAPANGPYESIIEALENPKMDSRSRSKKLTEVTPYFAHANVVKCSIGRLGNRLAPDQMYKNCRNYLIDELPILRPDIIVTQGKLAADVVFGDCTDRLMERVIDDKRILCIRTYHPSYYRSFWKDGKTADGRRWGIYIDAAADFMKP